MNERAGDYLMQPDVEALDDLLPLEACLHPAVIAIPGAAVGRCLECATVVLLAELERRWDAVPA